MPTPAVPILVINLDRSPERWARISSDLIALGLSPERVSAVEGKKLAPDALAACYREPTGWAAYEKRLSPGEIGCYLSHRRCWELIVERQLPYAVILEDDAAVTAHVPALLAQLESGTWPAWDYLKLANPVRRRRWRTLVPGAGVDLVAYEKIPSCTVAQVVSLAGAKKLLARRAVFSRPVDIDLQYPWEADLTIYGVKPEPFATHDFGSEIAQTGARRGKASRLRSGLPRKLDHGLRQQWYNLRRWGRQAGNWPSC